MGRATRRIRRNKSFFGDVSYRWSDELEDYVQLLNQQQQQNCSDLRNYTYENRPVELEFMDENDFKSMQEFCPYFYVDDEGEVHFLSEYTVG